MNLRDFYKEHYFHEANRRHQLSGALAIPVGVLTLLTGVLTVIIREIDLPLSNWEMVQGAGVVISAILIGISTCFLILSYYGYSYGYIATPLELKNHYEKLVKYYENENEAEGKAKVEIEHYIDSEYAQYTDLNTKNNDRKSGYIHRASGYIIAALSVTIFTAIPYVLDSVVNKKSEAQKIKIVSFPSEYQRFIEMSDKKSTSPPPQKQETPAKPTKPTPPPGRVIKENSDKPGEKR